MTRSSAGCATAIFVVLFAMLPAGAQVTVDASKITCDQFVHNKMGNPRTLAAWLNGYYHGKADKPVVSLDAFDANLSKLERFCYDEKNFTTPVMQAIEKLFGSAK